MHLCLKPTVKWFPKRFADEKNGHLGHFTFLHEKLDFGVFVEGAITAREEDVNFGAHSKHDFSGEEIVKLHLIGDVGVNVLLVGKGNIEANTATAGFVGATIGRLHDAWAATGNDRVAILGEEKAKFVGEFTPFAVRVETCGSKDGDAL